MPTDPAHEEGDSGPCGSACGFGSAKEEPVWTYAGKGQGDYNKVEDYEYAGEGKGDHKKEVKESRGGCLFALCCCLLLILLLVALLFVWAPWKSKSSTTTTGVTTTAPFDCQAGLTHWELGWSNAKKEWCCKHQTLGCVGAAEVHNCTQGEPSTWEERKATWCCVHECVGCPTPMEKNTTTTLPSNLRGTNASGAPSSTSQHPPLSHSAPFSSTGSATSSDSPPKDKLTCDLRCSSPGASKAVALAAEGKEEEGRASGALSNVGLEQCRQACAKAKDCKGISFSNKSVEGGSSCTGLRDFHLDKCQPGGSYITEISPGFRPWGKCVVFGDPHILTFDRVHGPPITDVYPGDFYLIKSAELVMSARFGYTRQFRTESSAIGLGVSGSSMGGHTLVVQYVGPKRGQDGVHVMLDSERILTSFPSRHETPDGLVEATFAIFTPDDFHVEARRTIGGVPGSGPRASLYFQMQDLKIYCLIGEDSFNFVIEARKTASPQDGFCGNFNCDQRDDSIVEIMRRGFANAVPMADSVFPASPSPPGWMLEKIGGEVTLDNCDPAVKLAAGKRCGHLAGAQHTECVMTACTVRDMALAGDLTKEEEESELNGFIGFSCVVDRSAEWTTEEQNWCCAKKHLGCDAGGGQTITA